MSDADIYQPEFGDLYWPHEYVPAPDDKFHPNNAGSFDFAHPEPPPTQRFCEIWRDKVIEVVDRYHPDIIYFDNRVAIIPESYRMQMLAHYYNVSKSMGHEVVMTYKDNDFAANCGIIDIEAGQLTEKASFVWQTDDVLDWDSWAYLTQPNYKSAGRILHQMIDVVSKNGNMLLDVGPRADGTIPAEVESRLRKIGAWLRINGEAIYETRPAERFGEGPTIVKKGSYVADRDTDFTAQDIRFTTRDRALYVLVLGSPASEVHVKSITRDTPLPFGTLRNATLLGSTAPLRWEWTPDGLVLHIPESRPSQDALVIKLT